MLCNFIQSQSIFIVLYSLSREGNKQEKRGTVKLIACLTISWRQIIMKTPVKYGKGTADDGNLTANDRNWKQNFSEQQQEFFQPSNLIYYYRLQRQAPDRLILCFIISTSEINDSATSISLLEGTQTDYKLSWQAGQLSHFPILDYLI